MVCLFLILFCELNDTLSVHIQPERWDCSIRAEPLLNFAGRGDFAQRCTHLYIACWGKHPQSPLNGICDTGCSFILNA